MHPQKQSLRQAALVRREALSRDMVVRWSELVTGRLLRLPLFAAAQTICTYISVRNEVRTRELIEHLWEQGKTVLVPTRNDDDTLGLFKLDDWAQVLIEPTGWIKPTSEMRWTDMVDATIVPGLAFTEHGDRLGQGAGHYDRFLATHPETISYGLAFELQVFNDLPHEDHDQHLNYLVTEHRAIRVEP